MSFADESSGRQRWASASAPIRSIPIEELHRLLEGLVAAGLDADALCGDIPGGAASAAVGHGAVPVELPLRALARAEELSGDPHIGVRTGSRSALNHVVAHLAAARPTLRDALEELDRSQQLLFGGRALHLELERDDPTVLVRCGEGAAYRPLTEYWTASLCREVATLAGTDGPRAVAFSHGCAGSVLEYERALGCPVVFGVGETEVQLHRSVLETPLRTANRLVANELERLVANLLATAGEPRLSERVIEAIRLSILAGTGGKREAIARELTLSVRTLQRRLEEEGITFRELRDGVRCERAIELAGRDDLTVAALAGATGFTDPSALTRAFKRWKGVSPGRYRSRQGAPPGDGSTPAETAAAPPSTSGTSASLDRRKSRRRRRPG